MGKERRQPWGVVLMHAFSLWQVLRHPEGDRWKGRAVTSCAWGMLCAKKNGAARQKRGPCMPRDWIPNQEPRWELPDIYSMSCRRGGRFS